MHGLFRAPTLAAFVIGLAACGGQESEPPKSEATKSQAPQVAAEPTVSAGPDLATLAEGEHRSADNRARNVYRHPVETLEFFGLRPDSRVMEIWPSGGWYTEVIAPFVNERGKYYAAHWDPDSDNEFVRTGAQRFKDKLAANPELYGNAEMAYRPPEYRDPRLQGVAGPSGHGPHR